MQDNFIEMHCIEGCSIEMELNVVEIGLSGTQVTKTVAASYYLILDMLR